jgi:STE24 endopeptidase
MTATRIGRVATLAVAAAVWVVAAAALWRTRVPTDLHLPELDPTTVFGAHATRAGIRFDRFLDYAWLLGTLAEIATLVVLVRRGPRLARSLGLGPVNAGIVTGVVVSTVVWTVSLPFDFAGAWWSRRHGISKESWSAIVFSPWQGLLARTAAIVVVLALLLLLARRFAQSWWIPGAAILFALGVLIQFLLPYANRTGTHPVRSPTLRAAIARLETSENAGHPVVRIQPVHDSTTAANAYAVGIGPSRSLFLWDTLLDGRFTRREVQFVAGHELAHLARRHIWKGLAWGVLFGAPILAAVAFATGRRGGLRNAGTVPLALLTVVVLQLVLTPLENVVSRRYEAEADWVGLQGTHDPAAARGLFKGFVTTDLQDPDPPGWVHLFLDDHPTALHRIEQADAWEALHR